MCLLIYKPAGVKFSRSMLEAGHRANSQSWGVAAILPAPYRHIWVDKGLSFKDDPSRASWAKPRTPFEDGEDYKKEFRHIAPVDMMVDMLERYECIAHFRIASSGSVCVQNAHPIHTGSGDTWVAHNGTMSDFTNRGQGDDVSDTARLAEFLGSMNISKLLGSRDNPCEDCARARPIENSAAAITGLVGRKYAGRLLYGCEKCGRRRRSVDVLLDRIVKIIGWGNKVTIIDPTGVIIMNKDQGSWEDGCWVSNIGWKYGRGNMTNISAWEEEENELGFPFGGGARHWTGPHRLPDNRATTNLEPVIRRRGSRNRCFICKLCDCGGCNRFNCRIPGEGKRPLAETETGPDFHNVYCRHSKRHDQYCDGLDHQTEYVDRDGGKYMLCNECRIFMMHSKRKVAMAVC